MCESPSGLQGDSSNVEVALTRFVLMLAQVFLSGSKSLERLYILVAGGRYRRNLPRLTCQI
jgi:hypothetical protein